MFCSIMICLAKFLVLVLLFHDVMEAQSSPLELVTFWGQNEAAKTLGIKEPSLEHLCQDSPYTTVVVGYVYRFFDQDDFEEELPTMNFTTHCKYYVHNRLSCPHMREAIHLCHVNNKKVLIGLGGPNVSVEFTRFETKERAIAFAHTIWNLFLGGKELFHLRPFGNVMLDGINLRMDEQDPENLPYFIATLNNLRQERRPAPDKNFLITISPTCHFPGTYFGPQEGNILSDPQIIPMIDQVYVWYTDISCCVRGTPGFIHSHDEWNKLSSERNLNFYFGIPTKRQAADPRCYLPPTEQMKVFQRYQNKNINLKGLVLIDNSHDIDETLTIRYGFTNVLVHTYESTHTPITHPPDLLTPIAVPTVTPTMTPLLSPTKASHLMVPGHLQTTQAKPPPHFTQKTPTYTLPESTISNEDDEVGSIHTKTTPTMQHTHANTHESTTWNIAQEAESIDNDVITTLSPTGATYRVNIATSPPIAARLVSNETPLANTRLEDKPLNRLIHSSCFSRNRRNKTLSKSVKKKCLQFYSSINGTTKLELRGQQFHSKFKNDSSYFAQTQSTLSRRKTKPKLKTRGNKIYVNNIRNSFNESSYDENIQSQSFRSNKSGKHEPLFVPFHSNDDNADGDKYYVVV